MTSTGGRDEARSPRFSDAEMARRRGAVLGAMEDAGADHVVVYGANRFGSGIGWLTGWPVTREAALVMSRHHDDVLLVQHYNHVPNARRVVTASDVRWGGRSTIGTALEVIAGHGGRGARVGIVGPLGYRDHERVVEFARDVVDLSAAYTRLRMVKSPEEIEWLRTGARMSDRAIETIIEDARAGDSDHDVVELIERSYLASGGTTHIHYLGVTSMREPDRCVPSQYPDGRELRVGDVLTVEISASYWDYAGQVLRTFTVDSDPTELYRRLHAVAEAAFDAVASTIRPGAHAREVVAAARVIEDAGFTIYDDLVHGFGGGYLPPVLGSDSRALVPVPDMTFEAGMTVVIQPNVVTPDERAGVQTGELVVVTDDGVESLHRAPRGMLRIDAA